MFFRLRLAAAAVAVIAPVSVSVPKAMAQSGNVGAPDVYAITNARIVTASGKTIAKGTVVVRDGLIAAVGEKVDVPADARVFSGSGLTIYPGMVDGLSHLGMPGAADYTAARPDAYALSTIRAENNAPALFRLDAAALDARRRMGFGAALVAPNVGIFSGTSAVMSLGSNTNAAALVIRPNSAMHLDFNAPEPTPGYPGSLMGEIAAARQALLDARDFEARLEAYEKNPRGKKRPAAVAPLAALRPAVTKKMPLVIQASSAQEILRALKFAKEFGLRPIIDGGIEAYKVASELKAADAFVLLSANLPDPPRVTPGEEDTSTLQGLRRRALAPRSAALLAKAGVPFALTTSGMTSTTDFVKNVHKMVLSGLTEAQALEAATLAPAKFWGVDQQLGTVETGKIANLVVVEGNGSLFDEKTKVKYVFVDGENIDLDAPRAAASPIAGGTPTPGGGRRPGGAPGGVTPPAGTPPPAVAAAPPAGSTPVPGAPALNLPPGVTPEMALEYLRNSPNEAKQFLPPGVTVEQAITALSATKQNPETPTPNAAPPAPVAPPVVGEGLVPPLPAPLSRTFVLRGATVWTVGAQGVLTDADVYVKDGKIAGVGQKLSVPGGTLEISGQGKHVTPGMIDAHSHTAIEGGVNEGTNIVTAEVRIADVLDAEDVNIYRQLAGGTTMANVLHGSANAIGGQNAVVKWRWGKKADELIFGPAPQGIKFALGENPKRSNGFTTPGRAPRYPNTRMGVEREIRATFSRARDYQADWKAYKEGKTPVEPRRDLQLDAIVEILEGKRLVHCHSYRQDEILMMLRVAEEYGFRVATFQHVLEGYKVADEMAKHGAGGSTFSDWWAFKVEAWDAIPYNGALMTERGVVSSFNSDSSELARRLNTEAAKAVHWGGMTPAEAIKLVTINPAKQLRIDKYVGSLEVGKDADLVVWSGDPLSSMTICEKTWVDGDLLFDRASDIAARPALDAEKKRLALAERPSTPAANRPGVNGPRRAPGTTAAAPPTTPPARPTLASVKEVFALVPESGPTMAIVGATVHPVSAPAIANGVVLTRGGKIVAVGTANVVAIPADAKRMDATGLHVYPGMIDADNSLGVSEIESLAATIDNREIGQFNPELRTAIAINPDSALIPVARQNGVLNAVTAPTGGTLSGMGALIQLDGWTWEDVAINKSLGLYLNFPTLGQRRFREVAHRCEEESGAGMEHDSLLSDAFVPAGSRDTNALKFGDAPQPPAGAPGGNPFRPAGTTDENAALRPLNDFLEQARRYRDARSAEDKKDTPRHDRDPRLEAMLPVLAGNVPLFVRADRDRDIRAAVAWAKRNNFKMVLVGGQEADKCADVLVRENVPVILGPVQNLPARFDSPYDDAYTLPARLMKAGVKICLSTGEASNARRLPYQAAQAASYGLPHDEALKAITLYAAQIVGAGDRLGSLEVGKDANIIVTTGDPLEITSVVRAAFIAGQPVDLSTKQTRLYEKYRSRPRPVATPEVIK